MRKMLIAISSALALTAAGSPAAHADNAGVPQIEPVILGEVVHMNSHSVSVRTQDGETLPFEFDSRTVMPTGMLASGTRVRVEFRLLDSGIHLAQRVTPLEMGSKDWETLENASAMSPEESETNDVVPASYHGGGTMTHTASAEGTESNASTTSNTGNDEAGTTEAQASKGEDEPQTSASERTEDKLPATASGLPLTFAVGAVLLAGAAGLWWGRRRAA